MVYSLALVGILMQFAVFTWAAVVAWYLRWKSQSIQNYGPLMFIGGTLVMCSGVLWSACLIGNSTSELTYQRMPEASMKQSASRIYWIQPGDQVIGDQEVSSFAFSDAKKLLREYQFSSKLTLDGRTRLHTTIAVLLSALGYISQFIGLRSTHPSVSMAQLGVTLAMAHHQKHATNETADPG